MFETIDEHPSKVARAGQGEPRARACTRNGARTQVDVNEPWEIFHLSPPSSSPFLPLLLLPLVLRVRTSFVGVILLLYFCNRALRKSIYRYGA